jgi:hypothetical protein
VGCANRYSEECFLYVGQGALEMSLWNQGGGVPKKFGNHCSSVPSPERVTFLILIRVAPGPESAILIKAIRDFPQFFETNVGDVLNYTTVTIVHSYLLTYLRS